MSKGISLRDFCATFRYKICIKGDAGIKYALKDATFKNFCWLKCCEML